MTSNAMVVCFMMGFGFGWSICAAAKGGFGYGANFATSVAAISHAASTFPRV